MEEEEEESDGGGGGEGGEREEREGGLGAHNRTFLVRLELALCMYIRVLESQ